MDYVGQQLLATTITVTIISIAHEREEYDTSWYQQFPKWPVKSINDVHQPTRNNLASTVSKNNRRR